MKKIIKLKIGIIVSLIFCLILAFIFIISMNKDTDIAKFGKISIRQISNSSDNNNIEIIFSDKDRDFFINGYLKSGFVNDDVIYLGFYIPFNIYSENNTLNYNIITKYKDKITYNFDEDYYYILYYVKNKELLYLNAKKEIIYGNTDTALDYEKLDLLDNSDLVNIGNIKIVTKFNTDKYIKKEHIDLVLSAYQYLLGKINLKN